MLMEERTHVQPSYTICKVLGMSFEFFKKNFYVCGCFSLHACLYTVCTPGARGDKNKELDPLELQLLMAVS